MAKIHSIQIQNFRGIKSFNQSFANKDFIVLIGRGDSGKSTILKAISYALSPTWNLPFTDADFYDGDTSQPIKIDVTLSDVPSDLLSDDKFGLYYRLVKEDQIIDDVADKEADQSQQVLTIELVVDDTLEPKWYIVTNREGQEPKEISNKDRALFNMFFVADYADSHFAYNRLSPLAELLRQDGNNVQEIAKNLQNIVRTTYEQVSKKEGVKLNFDDSTDKIKKEAKKLGLDVDTLNTALEYKENAYTESNISLHSNNIPYRLHGKGTKRLMSMAIQLALAEKMGILLIDEIEQGLEPDRVRNIVRVLKKENRGQIFITTHANGTVLEAGAEHIFLMRFGCDRLQQFSPALQGALRHHPEAFFAKSCVFCEGATEYGFLRAIDNAIQQEKGYGLATMGLIGIESGGSDRHYEYACEMQDCGYDVITFNDDDNQDIIKKKCKAIDAHVPMVICEQGMCIEQQIFKDVLWDCLCEIVLLAAKNNHEQSILSVIQMADIHQLRDAPIERREELRNKLGNAAKKHSWYKNVSLGEDLGNIVLKHVSELDHGCQLYKEISELRSWILRHAID